MGKKVTIREVAQMAGVSVATVSYVLNQRAGQKISEPTKKKVLQISNLLGYRNSALVKSLINDKSNNVVLFYHDAPNMLKKAMDLDFFERLAAALHCLGKDLLVIPDSLKEKASFCDAIVCYDTPVPFFREVGNSNFVPLIGVDVNVNDPLFFQIGCSMRRAKDQALGAFGDRPFAVLFFPYADEALTERVRQTFPQAQPVGSMEELLGFLAKKPALPVLAMGRPIYDTVRALGYPAVFYDTFPGNKIDQICAAIQQTVSRTDKGNKWFEY